MKTALYLRMFVQILQDCIFKYLFLDKLFRKDYIPTKKHINCFATDTNVGSISTYLSAELTFSTQSYENIRRKITQVK